jgi:hypothetical protein
MCKVWTGDERKRGRSELWGCVGVTRRTDRWFACPIRQRLADWQRLGRDVALLVGGANGLNPRCLGRADQRCSLSPLTLPHALVRSCGSSSPSTSTARRASSTAIPVLVVERAVAECITRWTDDLSGRPFLYRASRSERRHLLLAQLGVPYETLTIALDECWDGRETPCRYVRRLALAKAVAGAMRLAAPLAPVLAADTAVVLDGEILGEPEGPEEPISRHGMCQGGGTLVPDHRLAFRRPDSALLLRRTAPRGGGRRGRFLSHDGSVFRHPGWRLSVAVRYYSAISAFRRRSPACGGWRIRFNYLTDYRSQTSSDSTIVPQCTMRYPLPGRPYRS